jgi:hypothetical protein
VIVFLFLDHPFIFCSGVLRPEPCKPHFHFAGSSLWALPIWVPEGDEKPGEAEGCGPLVYCLWAFCLPTVSLQHYIFTPSVVVPSIVATDPVCSFYKTCIFPFILRQSYKLASTSSSESGSQPLSVAPLSLETPVPAKYHPHFRGHNFDYAGFFV